MQRNYTVSVLDDIGVHHFDLIRYLSGAEGRYVQASLFNPIGGWEEPGAVMNAYAHMELEGGIRVGYSASIAARGTQTPWCGNWRIEGTQGAVELIDQVIHMTRGDQTTRIDDFSGEPRIDCLSEFVASLQKNREAETSGRHYLNTQAMVHYTNVSSTTGARTEIILPVLE